MLRAVALDDEIPALEVIEAFASRMPELDLKAVFSKTRKASQYLAEHPIDLLFLDINMPAISGLDFARSIDQDIIVIFTTSYTEYAIESYELDAVDYLLKPFAFQRFQQAIEKAQTLHAARQLEQNEPLLFRINHGTVKVQPEDIRYIEGLDNYVKIHLTDDKPLVIRMPMKKMLAHLPEGRFVQVHRSYIVALQWVEQVKNKTILIEGHEIPLSKTYEADFRNRFRPIR